MIKFAERHITPSGSPFRSVYKLKFSGKTGAEELVKTGKENFQEYIQSFAESCDLSVIISRVNAGEVDLLSARMGSYGDFRDVPQTKAEMLQSVIDSKQIWDSLTDQQRGEFEDFNDFAGSAGSIDWLKKLGYDLTTEVAEEVKGEVKNAES